MASRKEQKEQARQRRLAEEQAQAAKARRRRRMQMLGGVVVAAIAVVAVAVAISAGSTGSPGLASNKHEASKTYNQVNNLLQGIPQSGATLGNPKAPVTMLYYGDLECPICRDFTLGVAGGGFPELVQKDVRQGKVKVVYKAFCTATCTTGSGQSVFNSQQVAAYAAGKQKRFWDYTELFYRQQGQEGSAYVTPAFLNTLAKQIPDLNLTQWTRDRGDPSLLSQVQADETSATKLGLSGTPTLIAQGPKGSQAAQSAIPSYAQLETTIKQVT